MVWIASFGILLQAVGLAVAVVGVAGTYQESLGRPLLPDLLDDLRRWAR